MPDLVGSPVVCAAPPVPGMFAPGLPPDAAVPEAPPTIPVSLPVFSSTSSAAPGGTVGAAELGAAVLAGGVIEGVSPLAAGDATVQRLAANANKDCPISRLLNTTITMEAKLLG